MRGLSLWNFAAATTLAMLTGALIAHGQTTAPATTTATAPSHASAVVIELHGDVDNLTRDTLFRRFKEARASGAHAIILSINTNGGLSEATLDMTRFLRNQPRDVHTVAFIAEKAYSAGIIIALAADELVTTPGAMIGDAAPIAISPTGLVPLGETERAKAESPILADVEASAARNGYDPLLVGSLVTVGRVVHYVQSPDGATRRFVDAETYKSLKADGWKPVEGIADPVDRADTLLTVDSSTAEKLGLSKGTYESPQALAAERGWTITQTYAPGAGERLIGLFDNPVLRFILMIVFMQSLYAALHAPGHGFPEVLALSSLGVLVGVPMLTGYAQWWEVLAILIGLVLIALELFVIPGFGLPGITGIILFLFGLTMTFVGSEPSGLPGVLPSLAGTRDALKQGLFIVTAGMACSLLLWVWLSRYLPKLPYFNKLILSDVAGGGEAGAATMTARDDGMPTVGDAALAVTDLRPGGSARLEASGHVTPVVSESGFVKAGQRLVVREVAGNRIVVRAVT